MDLPHLGGGAILQPFFWLQVLLSFVLSCNLLQVSPRRIEALSIDSSPLLLGLATLLFFLALSLSVTACCAPSSFSSSANLFLSSISPSLAGLSSAWFL